MSIGIMRGDLISAAKRGHFDLIAHGCNCFHTMGAGIAKQIKEQFPEAYITDLQTPYGDIFKLGTISKVIYSDLTVVNCYTQFYFSQKYGPPVDYNAIRGSFQEIYNLLNTHPEHIHRHRIGIPMIGCGLAGGKWDIVAKIVEEELDDFDVTVMYI